MALSNRDRIGKALDHLRDGLLPYISNQLYDNLSPNWQEQLPPNTSNLKDVSVLLGLFMTYWTGIFKRLLSQSDRAYISELKEARNKWAHSESMSSDDVDRYLDTAIRLCRNINASEQAEAIRRIREELQQQVFSERARYRTRYQASIENQTQVGLKPWREVITPHRDVIDGKYQQAEFAADLDLVQRGIGSAEYTDPVEFYRRTFITDGLKKLICIALQRFNSQSAEPVIELQTNFGGGKTHSMLALYHLCSGISLDKLPGLDQVCSEIGINSVPSVSCAVLVGTAFNPSTVDNKPDGTKVHTLWGELAWQIGGAAGYAQIAESDQQKVAPGTRALAALFKAHGPCLILIDEWVAYARNLVSKSDLPAGTYDTQLTFAQQLTEATKQVANALLLISVPQSINEIGGSDGQIACDGLKNVAVRLAFQWRPATGNESFEIVRRRLFEPIQTKDNGTSRDAVVRAFTDMYSVNKSEFPSDSREPRYKDLLTSAYPIHPDLFEKLYEEWSTLDRFQRTRGVLRLLALTIESLWNGDSKDLLIMPSSIPIDDNDVKNELVRFLDNQWEPIISQDVDGAQSIPTNLDKANPNFGRVSACKRVARSLYIGTAPGAERQQKGINDQSVKLGCVMPGEPIGVFGDALRRLGDRGKYIQQDGDRYWIDTSPNLNRTAEDYKESYLRQSDDLIHELNILLQNEGKKRGKFSGIHSGQISDSDIPDDPDTRLVLIAAQYTHQRGNEASSAMKWVENCLKNKGNTPRKYLNSLLFLAPDERNLKNLLIALAERRAWKRVVDEKKLLNLTVNQEDQATARIEQAWNTIKVRLPETWCHLLIPYQTEPSSKGALFEQKSISGGKGSLAEQACEKCIQEDLLFEQLGARLIRDKLNNFLWDDKPHIQVRELIYWCRKYLYLPRITSDQVILDSLINPTAAMSGENTFFLADGLDENNKIYIGLRPQQASSNQLPSLNSYIVKNDIAKAQPQITNQTSTSGQVVSTTNQHSATKSTDRTEGGIIPPAITPKTSFTASLKLNPTNASLQTSQFVDEVMSHLQALPNCEIEMSIEVQAKAPNGIDEETARIIIENSNSLKVNNPQIY
tara:strand:+ start:5657 stop:8923 length:3267 start_codon:yes stop_codon:yes gene_type:complete